MAGGELPFEFDASNACVSLATPRGEFCVTILDGAGSPVTGADVVHGSDMQARGWHSRNYGEKEPVPSLAAAVSGPVPLTFISLLGAGKPSASVEDGEWSVSLEGRIVSFRIAEGRFSGGDRWAERGRDGAGLKILVVHQYYLMPGQFGGSRLNEMSRLWCQQGHQVTVIAGTVDHGHRRNARTIPRAMDHHRTGWPGYCSHRCYVPATYGKVIWAACGLSSDSRCRRRAPRCGRAFGTW